MPAAHVQGGAVNIPGLVLSGPTYPHDILRLLKRNGLGLRGQLGRQQLRSQRQAWGPEVCPPAVERLRAT